MYTLINITGLLLILLMLAPLQKMLIKQEQHKRIQINKRDIDLWIESRNKEGTKNNEQCSKNELYIDEE